MLKNHGCLTLLLLLAFASCKDCDQEAETQSLDHQLIPYVEGSTFNMVDENGRIIHFMDSSYESGISTGVSDPNCQCCPIENAEYIDTKFGTDSVGFDLEVRQSPFGSEDEDLLGIWFGLNAFQFIATNTTAMGRTGHSTQATAHASLQIGNRSYSNVFEAWNTDTISYAKASRIWYNATDGLLKVEFFDSTSWVIQN